MKGNKMYALEYKCLGDGDFRLTDLKQPENNDLVRVRELFKQQNEDGAWTCIGVYKTRHQARQALMKLNEKVEEAINVTLGCENTDGEKPSEEVRQN